MQKYKVYINNRRQIIVSDWKSFCADKYLIKAAGGIVYNINNQVLMIFRNKKWDLPKGKLEFNEDIRECAIREVKEECGVQNLVVISKVEETYHTYKVGDRKMIKHTVWFRMRTDYDGDLIPQNAEGITKVEWVDQQDIVSRLEYSYLSIKDLLINR